MSPWGWRPERSEGIWRHGLVGLRPLVAAVPWITLGLLLMMFHLLGGTLFTSEGLLVDLPETALDERDLTDSVALMTRASRETLVFFDDARYLMSDSASLSVLADHLATRASKASRKTLLALVDRRIPSGELIQFVDLARKGGFTRVLFAKSREKKDE